MDKDLKNTLLNLMERTVELMSDITKAYQRRSLSKGKSERIRGLIRRIVEEAQELP